MRHVIFGLWFLGLQVWATVRFYGEHRRRVRETGTGYSRWIIYTSPLWLAVGYFFVLAMLFDWSL